MQQELILFTWKLESWPRGHLPAGCLGILQLPSKHQRLDVTGITKRRRYCFPDHIFLLLNRYKVFCSVLHILFNSNSGGSLQPHVHLPTSCIKPFCLCVREEVAGEAWLKMKHETYACVPAASFYLLFDAHSPQRPCASLPDAKWFICTWISVLVG